MNRPFGARKLLRVPAIGMVLLLFANLVLVPSAHAAIVDSFGSAFDLTPALSSSPFTFSDSGTDVSSYQRDPEEVNGLSTCGNYSAMPANTYSVWYTFTPTASGWLTLQTMNAATNYDTVIEVWKSTLQAANSVGCNDDAVAANRRSELTLPVTASTKYLIAVRSHDATPSVSPFLAFDASFGIAREFFVDQTSGSDANIGSQTLPFRTIGKAEQSLPAVGGIITIIDPGIYNEAVTMTVPTVLRTSSSSATVASMTLAASPVTTPGSVNASTVTVQPGAKVQEGVDLAMTNGLLRLANGTYTETLMIGRDLTVQALNEGASTIKSPSAAAVTLTGGAVTLTGLNLQGTTGVVVTGGAGHSIRRNNIAGNTSGVGINNQTATQVDATRNWWGNAAGPAGAGDDVQGNVLFRPWCDTPLPACTNAVGAATRLGFASSPAATRASVAFATQPVVQATDDLGTVDTSFTGVVTLTIKSGTGTVGATLGGTVSMSAVAGVADFAGKGALIDYVGQGYKLTATSGALDSTATNDSAAFTITADRLVVTSSPASPTAAGTPLAMSLAAQDGAGHTDLTFTGNVTLAIQTNPTAASLQGTTSKPAASGTVTFGGAGEASIAKPGTGYTLRASSGTLSTADSAAFDIISGAAAKLVFSTSPSNSTAGVAFAPQPTVEVQDPAGNVVTGYSGSVTLTFGSNAGGGTLSGTTTVNVSNGQAVFSGLSIDKAGVGYTLSASSTGLSSGTSAGFNINAAAPATLAFVTVPGNTRAGQAFAAQPSVEALDAFGNRATSFAGSVTLVIKAGTGTAGAMLLGTATVNAANGLASFSGLGISMIGTGYQLSATATGLTGADSASFDITANGLAFTLQPVTSTAGQVLLVKVAAQDGQGNTDTAFTGMVTLTLKNAGRTATLLGTTTLAAVNGVADFTNAGLNIRKAGSGYIITAMASGLADADSAAFNILPAAASKLVFNSMPVTTRADAIFTADVEAQDAFGNLDTSFTNMVSLALKVNPGSGILGGTTSTAAVAGHANFPASAGLNIDRVGVGYVLRASSGSLVPADSALFTITANRLLFTIEPATTQVGNALTPAPTVQAVDRFGTVDVTFTGAISLTLKRGAGTAGASLRGTTVLGAIAGVGSFDSISVDRLGTGYQLNAAAAGLLSVSSAAFDVTRALAYVPLAIMPPLPDLVGTFSINKSNPTAYEPVLITAIITNTGEVAATQFWVDFYINPANPPTAANQPWDKRCDGVRCRYGIAWYVGQSLAPGQSITLTSTRSNYFLRNTDWPGYFVSSKLDLYMYIDSWNKLIDYGAVYERNEANNRSELHIGAPVGAPFAAAPNQAGLQALPAR